MTKCVEKTAKLGCTRRLETGRLRREFTLTFFDMSGQVDCVCQKVGPDVCFSLGNSEANIDGANVCCTDRRNNQAKFRPHA